MKATEHKPFVNLAAAIDTVLCSFCRYATWSGTYCDADNECKHPLPRVREDLFDEVQDNLEDCWGFRTSESWEKAVDQVEVWLLVDDMREFRRMTRRWTGEA